MATREVGHTVTAACPTCSGSVQASHVYVGELGMYPAPVPVESLRPHAGCDIMAIMAALARAARSEG